MFRKVEIKKNVYKDSIALMAMTSQVNQLEGVIQSSIGMATEMNKTIIADIGFDISSLAATTENDMVIALELEDETYMEAVLAKIEEFLVAKNEEETDKKEYDNTAQALKESLTNLAVVSIPGAHAYRDIKQCLDAHQHIMLFSDNMSIEDEYALKKYAASKDLLVMGPDCGTAIINGVGLCFANNVRKGAVGIVGASGTGIQEVSVLLDRYGVGISQAIGTGGRDLSADIGGIMMLKGMELLEHDDETKQIVIISKPPAKEVADKVLAQVRKSAKPYVVCFINAKETYEDLKFTNSLETAAQMASSLYLGTEVTINQQKETEIVQREIAKHQGMRGYLRGLYCGGTLAAESEMIIHEKIPVYSNVTKDKNYKLANPFVSQKHTIVDLGDDAFTQGKPHPMIDPTIRNARILEEAQNEKTAVLILDFELGYGSNDNPVGLTLPVIEEALTYRQKIQKPLTILCYVLTAQQEKQDVQQQLQLLANVDVIVTESNASAARIARDILVEIGDEDVE